jgi:hypothetical protein
VEFPIPGGGRLALVAWSKLSLSAYARIALYLQSHVGARGGNFSCLRSSMYVEDLVYLQSRCGALEIELLMSGGAAYLFPHPCAGAQRRGS